MKLKCIITSKAGEKGSLIERSDNIARQLIQKKICIECVEEKQKPEPKEKAEEKKETKKAKNKK